MTDHPSPGTEAAIERGCTCPVMDNPYKGIEGQYIYDLTCPLHGDNNE